MKPYLVSAEWERAQELTEEIILSKAAHLKLIYKLAECMESGTLPPHMIASQAYLDLIVTVDLACDSQAPVLITGETGTGKELLARTTHVLSNRSKGPFIAANCGGFTESLLEARLFGYTKGAFTGATTNQVGLFEAANGGTIFLDEIGDMSLTLQVHLLRVLQEPVIRPIGAHAEREVDVRVIAATNRNPEEEVRAGRFRADLFHRLNTYRLRIPPLRERREEIPHLVAHFLEIYQKQLHREGQSLSEAAMEAVCKFDWPGNVRQLENEIQRLVSLSMNNEVIGPERLSSEIRTGTSSQPTPAVVMVGGKFVINATLPLPEMLNEVKRLAINNALAKTDGNVTQAAAKVGVSRFGLVKMIESLGIEAEKKDQEDSE